MAWVKRDIQVECLTLKKDVKIGVTALNDIRAYREMPFSLQSCALSWAGSEHTTTDVRVK